MSAMLLLALSLCSIASAQVLYVDDDAAPGGDGQSWGTAFRFLQDALAVANAPKSGITEIRIGQGTYFADRNEANPLGTGDWFASFSLTSDLSLHGGYAGIGAVDPDAQDPARFESILSGDISPDLPYGDTRVIILIENASGITLSGLTVRDAAEQGVKATSAMITVSACLFADNVRGMLLEQCELVASQSVFRENTGADEFGGAVRLFECTASFVDCDFISNSADSAGGAIAALLTDLSIEQSSFSTDDMSAIPAEVGGFIFSHSGSLSVADCNFESNNVGFPTAISSGGAILVGNPDIAPSFINCTFAKMRAGYDGGPPGSSGGAVSINGSPSNTQGTVSFINCTFTQCAAGNAIPPTYAQAFGGAVYVLSLPVSFDNCSFVGNISRQGAAITCFAPFEVRNCSFTDNLTISSITDFWQSGTLQSCTYSDNRSCWSTFGVGTEGVNPDIKLFDCVFINNRAGTGSAITISPLFSDEHATVRATNCLLLGNRAETWCDSGNDDPGGAVYVRRGTVELTNCTIAHNTAEDTFGGIAAIDRDSTVSINNCILWENGDADKDSQFRLEPGFQDTIILAVNYSLISNQMTPLGVSNIDANPMFISEPDDGGDGFGDNPETPDIDESANDDYGDLRLMMASPAIDAGWNNAVPLDVFDMDDDSDVNEFIPFDLDGLPRFAQVDAAPDTGCGIGAIVDMGAYEFQGVPMQPVFGDVDGDQQLNMADLAAMLAAWGECLDNCCLEDLNADGVIDIYDLLTAMGVWE